MGINLIDKIVPKNDAFIGLVEADQVIGQINGGGFLPSSCISTNSIWEPNLKISNSPTDGYYLQYKDATDKLTWAEVIGGSDVAWSGASGYYSFSSNIKSLYVGSSQALGKFAPSKSVNKGIGIVIDGYGEIIHGLSPNGQPTTPNHWCIDPSGLVNFGISTRVDASKIYVYITAMGTKNVYWYAST